MKAICSLAMRSCSSSGRLTATLIPSRRAAVTVVVITALVLVNIATNEALARGRSRGRSSAAAAAARKKQTIQTIQNQVAVARQVLVAAESQTAMSEKELAAVRERITATRGEIEAAGSEEREALAALRETEADILDDQGPETPLGKAKAALDEAQRALDVELHRVVSLPEHAATLTPAERSAEARALSAKDRQTLQSDTQYLLALSSLENAKRDYARVREDVFKRDPEWVAASKAVGEAHRKESKAKRDGSAGALPAMSTKRNLRTSQEVAAAARATIAQGEAMLRQLGVKNGGGTSKPKK